MQFHRTLDRRLGVELGRKTDLEQHILDHVAAIRTRQAEWLSLEQNLIKAPGRGSQHRRITHFTLAATERQQHTARAGIAGRPGFARTGVRRVPISAQRLTIDKSLRNGIDDLLSPTAHQPGAYRSSGHLDQQHVIQPDAIEAVFECQHTLDLVGLDHRFEDLAHLQRRLPAGDTASATASRQWRECPRDYPKDAPIRLPARCR
jgi:hypothetical protein